MKKTVRNSFVFCNFECKKWSSTSSEAEECEGHIVEMTTHSGSKVDLPRCRYSALSNTNKTSQQSALNGINEFNLSLEMSRNKLK